MPSFNNFSQRDRSNKDSDTFKKPDLFENNKINENQIKDFQSVKEKWRELLSYFRLTK